MPLWPTDQLVSLAVAATTDGAWVSFARKEWLLLIFFFLAGLYLILLAISELTTLFNTPVVSVTRVRPGKGLMRVSGQLRASQPVFSKAHHRPVFYSRMSLMASVRRGNERRLEEIDNLPPEWSQMPLIEDATGRMPLRIEHPSIEIAQHTDYEPDDPTLAPLFTMPRDQDIRSIRETFIPCAQEVTVWGYCGASPDTEKFRLSASADEFLVTKIARRDERWSYAKWIALLALAVAVSAGCCILVFLALF